MRKEAAMHKHDKKSDSWPLFLLHAKEGRERESSQPHQQARFKLVTNNLCLFILSKFSLWLLKEQVLMTVGTVNQALFLLGPNADVNGDFWPQRAEKL